MTFKDSNKAFEQAISEDRLSDKATNWNYAGNFMYMGTDDNGLDLFKHRDTRRYIGAVPLKFEVIN